MAEDLQALVRGLDTSRHDLTEALAFIRLVVRNNLSKTGPEIAARPDVTDALGVVDDWIEDAQHAADTIVERLGYEAAAEVAPDLENTLDRLDADTDVKTRAGEWQASDEADDAWVAKIVLRMQWTADWLTKLVDLAALNAPYKIWVSRLDPKTCKYCRGLHGAVLPVNASFAVEAAKIGYTRIYGGLYAPPLHPRCRCTLHPFTQAEYDDLVRRAAA